MKYKLLNYLFGWDYILWRNSADNGLARVRVLPDGTIGYWRYSITKAFDKIESPDQVIWLTCYPEKYFEDKMKEGL